MQDQGQRLDPRGLIRESYRIEGITSEECRSIFLDWVLGLPQDIEPRAAIPELLELHGPSAQGHPMTEVLRDGLKAGMNPRRRGGWRSRPRP